jgi:hypothetical protein
MLNFSLENCFDFFNFIIEFEDSYFAITAEYFEERFPLIMNFEQKLFSILKAMVKTSYFAGSAWLMSKYFKSVID